MSILDDFMDILKRESAKEIFILRSFAFAKTQRLRIQKFVKQIFGEVAEWSNAAVLKTVIPRKRDLEFKSLPLR